MIDRELKIPLYIQIYDVLKEKIISNEFRNNELLPPERVLSEMFEVERATVRRSLDMLVNENMAIKFPGVGTKVSYTPPEEISNGPSTVANSIAFILPADSNDKITQPFIAEMFYLLEKECKKANYSLFYTMLHSDEDLPDIVLQKNVKGIIWLSDIEDRLVYKAKQLGIPSILISNTLSGFTSIHVDNVGGSCKAVKHLLGNEHKNIGFINGIESYLNAKERLQGYKNALLSMGIEFNNSYVKYGSWTFESGYSIMKEFLEESYKLSAIFAANDMMALGAIKAITEQNLIVPDDIEVVGFDNIEQCKYSTPTLTTICADVGLIANQAMKHLLELIDDFNLLSVKILIPTKLIRRESTR